MSLDVLYATGDAVVGLPDGGQVGIRKGEHWVADDPVVAQYPHLFSPDARYGARYSLRPSNWDETADSAPPVETATAAPGEKRAAARPARRA